MKMQDFNLGYRIKIAGTFYSFWCFLCEKTLFIAIVVFLLEIYTEFISVYLSVHISLPHYIEQISLIGRNVMEDFFLIIFIFPLYNGLTEQISLLFFLTFINYLPSQYFVSRFMF